MAAEASRAAGGGGGCDGPHMKLLCSHGGRLLPRDPDGALRYVGGETRVLAVPRAASFRDLTGRLAEMACGAGVRAIGHRLADEGLEDVIVSVTCDEELAHMRDEYDRLRAARPAARFRVFVTTTNTTTTSAGCGVCRRRAAAGLLPLAPAMRRVQSEQAHLHRRPASSSAPMRRVRSAQGLAGAIHVQPSFHHHRHQQCCCSCQRRELCAPSPPPARPMYAVTSVSKKEASPSMSTAKATGQAVVFTGAAREKATSRDAQPAMDKGRAIWEFE